MQSLSGFHSPIEEICASLINSGHKKYALELVLQYQEFPPQHENWNLYCPKNQKDYGRPYSVKNYYARNKIIAIYSEYIVAFVPRGVESKGAMSTINYAKKFRKKTLVID